MSKMECVFCGEIFDEEEILQGSPNYVPYGDTEVIESYESKCPYCGTEGCLEEYNEDE